MLRVHERASLIQLLLLRLVHLGQVSAEIGEREQQLSTNGLG
jgi:hypothetical protein